MKAGKSSMNYFVDIDLGGAITGIEKAEFNRLRLFQQAGLPAKIIYLTYKPRLHEFAKKFGIQDDSFSIYDYFQRSEEYADFGHFDWRHYWRETCHYNLQFIEGVADIRITDENGLFIMYASFYDADYSRLNYVNYFDKDHIKIRRDIYDSRGFLSCTCLLAEKDLINTELYYDQEGKVRIVKQYLIASGKAFLREITLKDYRHHDYYFGNEDEFRTFFFDSLYQSGDTFFADRNSKMGVAFSHTKPEVRIVAIFHSTHVRADDDPMTGSLKFGGYEYTLEHADKISRIVVSTEQQRLDLERRLPDLPPVASIPVGFAVPQPVDDVDFTQRNPHRIICVARYSPEKQLLHQVRAVERLVPEFPDVELHLLGYGGRVRAELQQYIDDHQLKDHVFLRGFQKDLTADYRQGALALMTSKEEGFSLATLESLSYSVPVISYDINYGPREMITDGQNGFLIPADDEEALYQKMRLYLGDRNLQLQMMRNCRPLLKRYSPVRVMQQWQDLVQGLE